ncbi:uncharacterized protein F5147DRAFT_770272 [Suillus discolor]|uniref:Uncharacterized protein n=1 Tax=Suillus discolor TaxID=1912936 RepID=A0A9P7FF80_9AGAM|nr:uncharacterized protein F5147DRAFT_770272 [Suillus discolor]KAG2114291.1 hypothetical protein F5147DRAFT_770272 [Suillus discolor]
MTNCAVGADGALKDASEIQWFNDADDDTPITPPPAKDSLAVLMQGGRQPASIKGGTRRSSCPFKPSARLRAADNTSPELSSGTRPRKRALSSADDAPIKKVAIRAAPEEDDLDDNLIPPIADGDDSSADDSEYTNNLDNKAEEADDTKEAYCYDKRSCHVTVTHTRRPSHSKMQTTRPAKHPGGQIAQPISGPFSQKRKGVSTQTLEHLRMAGGAIFASTDAGLPAHQSFFKGSISTRHTHISRNPKCHFPVYKSRCEAQDIALNERAIPASVRNSSEHQKTLDGSLAPKIPQFTKAGLMDYIVELIVSKDEAIQLIDKGPFHRLLQYLCPNLSDGAIPHHTKTCEEILERARLAVKTIKDKLAHIDSKISMMFDSWTSLIGDPFLSVTAHYIDAPTDKPQEC